MKKILAIVNSDVTVFYYRLELIEKLIEENYVINLSTPIGHKTKELEALGVSVIETHVDRRGTNPIKDYKLFRKYKSIIKKARPDIILTYTIKPNIYGGLAAKNQKIPYLANITGLGTGIQRKGLLSKFLIILYRKALKGAHAVFVQNEQNKSFVEEKKIFSHPILLPGSGVNLSKFTPVPYLESENLNIVFIGRVMKEKGIDEFLEAAIYFQKKGYKHKFHICGLMEDDYKEIIDSLVKEFTVIYHGLVDDMLKIYEFAHVVVNPSYHEGMSNVLLEGAAIARPLLASNIPGCKEIIDDGKNGLLFKAQDSIDLITKLETFVGLDFETRKQMGLSGRIKVEKEFNREIIVSRYIDEIKRIEGKE